MNQKPMLILIAGGTASGKGSLIASLGFLAQDDLSIIGIDYKYLAIEVEIKGVTWITKGKKGWVKKISGEDASDNELVEIKKARDENLNLLIDMQSKWQKPENVNWDKLLNDVKKELNKTSDTRKRDSGRS